METGTDLRIKLPVDIGSFKIAPLLILPLVENAFKHISHFKDPAQNKLYITILKEIENQFVVNIVNTYNPTENSAQLNNSSGLGLQNLERRLTLLYPDKYSLTMKRNENMYETTLKIQLHD
jgi:two-component system, LytTR family, sensor kinase